MPPHGIIIAFEIAVVAGSRNIRGLLKSKTAIEICFSAAEFISPRGENNNR